MASLILAKDIKPPLCQTAMCRRNVSFNIGNLIMAYWNQQDLSDSKLKLCLRHLCIVCLRPASFKLALMQEVDGYTTPKSLGLVKMALYWNTISFGTRQNYKKKERTHVFLTNLFIGYINQTDRRKPSKPS